MAIHRSGLALGLSLLAAGCNGPTMTATAPSLSALAPNAATLSMLDVVGPSGEQGQRFNAIFAQEARARGFVIAEPGAPVAATKIRAYLDPATSQNGQSVVSYVLQTSQDGRTRATRVSGTVPASGSNWTSLDDRTMRLVAQKSLEDLTRQLSGVNQPETETGQQDSEPL
ncbi:hypothetical protein MCEMSEM23_01705 [Rhabdaerophilaceae bacterium]